MDTGEIMAVALAQAGLQEVPSDSGIHIAGSGLRRALFGIDIEVAELLYAKEAAFDVVVAIIRSAAAEPASSSPR
jgi:hypothetical protein